MSESMKTIYVLCELLLPLTFALHLPYKGECDTNNFEFDDIHFGPHDEKRYITVKERIVKDGGRTLLKRFKQITEYETSLDRHQLTNFATDGYGRAGDEGRIYDDDVDAWERDDDNKYWLTNGIDEGRDAYSNGNIDESYFAGKGERNSAAFEKQTSQTNAAYNNVEYNQMNAQSANHNEFDLQQQQQYGDSPPKGFYFFMSRTGDSKNLTKRSPEVEDLSRAHHKIDIFTEPTLPSQMTSSAMYHELPLLPTGHHQIQTVQTVAEPIFSNGQSYASSFQSQSSHLLLGSSSRPSHITIYSNRAAEEAAPKDSDVEVEERGEEPQATSSAE